MTIQIISQTNSGSRIYFELATEKKSSLISFNPELEIVYVVCQNAAHNAWGRMGGRTFSNWTEALSAYKSADMKAMIEFAKNQCIATV